MVWVAINLNRHIYALAIRGGKTSRLGCNYYHFLSIPYHYTNADKILAAIYA
ncbi:hypothetical protein CRENPOLYSF2_2300006 [Crenothrix polyspora]|uniref:Uncharacterized protein n=1 Tax=Crenothrix polyspora TaxID=360316 RepID=A0A1R4H5X5_9GAMM|nr:hypothetical protein CRENPOLYSF2_2300006 [Crenothrix polyspora]